MAWSDTIKPGLAHLASLAGRTIKHVRVRTDLPLDAEEANADIEVVELVCTDGTRVQLGVPHDGAIITAIDTSPPDLGPDRDDHDDDFSVVTLVPAVEPDPDDIPAGAPGCSCVDEPGEDPLCKIHGKGKPDA